MEELLYVAIVSKYTIYFITVDYPVTVISTFKYFANNYKDYLTEDLVFIMSTILSFGNGIFRTVWGVFFDVLDFKKLITLSLILQIICAASFYFVAKIPSIVMIIIIITSAIAASSFTLIPASVYKKYGTKNGSEIYGIVFFAFGIASLIGPVLSKSLDLSHSKTTTPYAVLYEVGVLTGIIGLVLVYYLDINPVYKKKEIENSVYEDSN
jgi:MFS transporter, OFA family, oxalate/formate antiporter